MSYKVDWKHAERINVSQEEYKNLIEEFKAKGKRVEESKTKLVHWFTPGSWQVDEKGSYLYLYTKGFDGVLRRYIAYKDIQKEKRAKELEVEEFVGRQAFEKVSEDFKSRSGVSLRVAFGYVPKKDFEGMCPTASMVQNESYRCRTVRHAFKADISSAYPYELTKVLPDAHEMLTLAGRVRPTEEFPFAFYLKSYNIAVFGEFDSHDWEPTDFAYFQKRIIHDLPDDKEVTVLMRASKYSLKETFTELYNGRAEHEDNKMVMNAFIGFLHSKKVFPCKGLYMGHIAAVTIARLCDRIYKAANTLIAEGNTPLMTMTDSIAWFGKPSSIAENAKYLGSFSYEEYECGIRYYRTGQYGIFSRNRGISAIKSQGYKKEDLDLSGIKTLEDLDKIFLNPAKVPVFNKETAEFEEKYV